MTRSPSYIAAADVEALLLRSSNPDEVLIIGPSGHRSLFLSQLLEAHSLSWLVSTDVRTSDFPGGNLPRALNLSSRLFSSPTSVRSVIQTHIQPRLSKGLNLVITHCMRSQYRGPMAAEALLAHEDWPEQVEVKILDGGYRAWEKKYRGRKELFEGLENERGQIVGVRRGQQGKEEWEDTEELHSVELREAKGE